MDFLDQMLAEAAAEVKARAGKPKRGPVSREDEIAARENLYRPHRLVALFYRTTCARCGTVTDSFDGLFEERKHIRVSDLHMVRQPFVPLESGLPRTRKYLPRDVPYCEACAGLDLYSDEE